MHAKISNPLHFDRAVALIKKARNQARNASLFWREAENKNAPLWAENQRLRDLVASHERSIRALTHQLNETQERLHVIATAVERRV